MMRDRDRATERQRRIIIIINLLWQCALWYILINNVKQFLSTYQSSSSKSIYLSYLLELVSIQILTSYVYMELPRTISLPNVCRSMHAPSPTWSWNRQWTLSNCISLCLNWINLATEPFQWLDPASGRSCRGGSDAVLVSPPSSRHWRPISTVDNSSLYLPNCLTLLFPGLPGAQRAYGWLRLIRPHYYYYYYMV